MNQTSALVRLSGMRNYPLSFLSHSSLDEIEEEAHNLSPFGFGFG